MCIINNTYIFFPTVAMSETDVVHGINKSYNHLRHSDSPDGDGGLFGDLSQSVKDAKASQNKCQKLAATDIRPEQGQMRFSAIE